MSEDIERCARLMGMKPHREVQQVVPVDDGHAVRTHDGQWTLVRDDGTMRPCEEPLVVEREHGTAKPEPEQAKPEPKRRGRS